jgi:hypothetical protein
MAEARGAQMPYVDRLRRRTARRMVSGLLLALVAVPAGCGGHPTPRREATDTAWRRETTRRLRDLVTPSRPYTRFMVPSGRASLVPLAESVIALDRAGQPVPDEARDAVAAFWDARSGTFADRRTKIPELVTTWLGLRAAGAGRAAEAAAAVARRIVPGGAAWEPGGRADPLATLYAARVLAQGRGPAVARPLAALRATLACPTLAAGRQWDLRLAVTAETARLLGTGCRLRAPRPAAVTSVLARARAGLGGGGLPSVDTVERIRALRELERAGLLDAGATAPLVRTVAARIGRASSGALPVTTAIRGAVDLVPDAPVALAPAVLRRLQRDVRWHGALPDQVLGADPLETAMGSAALRLTGAGAAGSWVDWTAGGMRRGERALLALAFAPDRLRESDARAAMAAAKGSHGLRDFAIGALALHDAPGACAGERDDLGRVLARLQRDLSGLETVPPTTLYWLGLLGSGAAECVPTASARLRTEVGARLRAARRTDGLYGTATSKPADLLSTWAGLETDCVLGGGAIAPGAARGLARGARLAGGGAHADGKAGFSVLATFASLRVEQLASGGCDGGWLAARPGGAATLRLLRP